jgi:hypothetical protein
MIENKNFNGSPGSPGSSDAEFVGGDDDSFVVVDEDDDDVADDEVFTTPRLPSDSPPGAVFPDVAVSAAWTISSGARWSPE